MNMKLPVALISVTWFVGPALAQQDERTSNPHGRIEIPCQNCHATSSWRPIRAVPEFNHDTETAYPLRGLHEGVRCTDCHRNLAFSNVGAQCADCHADPHRNQFGARCEQCHTVQGWARQVDEVRDHQNRFPLIGAHAAVQCNECHTGAAEGTFAGLSTECVICHQRDFSSVRQPDHVAAGFPAQCEQCHNIDQWTNAQFDHNRFSDFPLTGAHTSVDCQACHVGGRFTGTPSDCFACHFDDFNSTTNPNHAEAGFPTDCEVCHTSVNWEAVSFDHNARTSFALTGRHTSADCQSCHVSGQFSGTPQECSGCHLEDFNQTTDPNHSEAGFPTTCERCHNTTRWDGAVFDHNTQTEFPLTGRHTSAECQSCHANGRFAGTPKDCSGCHLAEYNATSEPDHEESGFSTRCENCHNTAQWEGAVFDHNTSTRFPLTGKHAAVDCQQCHVNGRFAGTSLECESCHIDDYNRTQDPNHAAAGFPTACERCHNTSNWDGASFDHNTATAFPLTGKHTGADCAQCHVNGRFAGTPKDCAGCHLSDYDQTDEPDHAAAGFPTACETCHDTADWDNAVFDHNTTTRFPLTGRHVAVDCTQCHVNGRFAGTPSSCEGCHLDDYNQTNDPDHAAAGFPTACERCHNTSDWDGATFNHNSATRFPLTGKHTGVDCQQCHVNGRFAGTPTNCDGCHLNDYNQTDDPDHAAAGFPTDCSLCHNTNDWDEARFDHSQTRFPLTGAHQGQDCAGCHVDGRFQGLGTECANCHKDDYDRADDPDHAAAGFPLQCETCHSTTQWDGAVFDHNRTRFPLTGAHRTEPGCTDCHVNGRFAGTPTDCYSCHKTEYDNVGNPNHRAAGFPTDCTQCHNTTRWDGARFAHRFPIFAGNHRQQVWQVCSTCHPNGSNFKVFTCLNCHEHRKSKMDNEHDDVNGYVYNSANCLSCHPNGEE